jgi:hypothetical protein
MQAIKTSGSEKNGAIPREDVFHMGIGITVSSPQPPSASCMRLSQNDVTVNYSQPMNYTFRKMQSFTVRLNKEEERRIKYSNDKYCHHLSRLHHEHLKCCHPEVEASFRHIELDISALLLAL